MNYSANLQSTCADQGLVYETHMYSIKLHQSLALICLLLSPSVSTFAGDIDQLDWTGIKEHWGQTLLCQRIYSLSEVKPRLYDFDIKQCEQAALIVSRAVAKYSENEQAELKKQAERHAELLSGNTSSPYHAVPACRLFCRDVVESQDQIND